MGECARLEVNGALADTLSAISALGVPVPGLERFPFELNRQGIHKMCEALESVLNGGFMVTRLICVFAIFGRSTRDDLPAARPRFSRSGRRRV